MAGPPDAKPGTGSFDDRELDASVHDPLMDGPDPVEAERRRRLHEANNRLAAVIMNLAFARATLSACPMEEHLTPLERTDLATALEHAEDAANQLASVVRLLG